VNRISHASIHAALSRPLVHAQDDASPLLASPDVAPPLSSAVDDVLPFAVVPSPLLVLGPSSSALPLSLPSEEPPLSSVFGPVPGIAPAL
jgi:hypothetical protein